MAIKEKIKVLVIIPAKLDSTRLHNKNIQNLNGRPLVEHSIDYAKNSNHVVDIIISSENLLLKELADKNSVQFHHRSPTLCGDTEVVDVYIDVVKSLRSKYDLVAGLQPDNPKRSNTLDHCIQYMLKNNYDDLITINPEFKRSGSVRIFKFEYLKKSMVSKRIGCLRDNATDIHYLEDLQSINNS